MNSPVPDRPHVVVRLLVGAIRGYRRLSRLTPPTCRFTPTCSEYAIDALTRYGLVRGGGLALRRIARCHPFSKPGHDPVP